MGPADVSVDQVNIDRCPVNRVSGVRKSVGPTGQPRIRRLQVGAVCKVKAKRKKKKVARANGPKASWRPIKARLTRVSGSACGLQADLGSAQEGGPAWVLC